MNSASKLAFSVASALTLFCAATGAGRAQTSFYFASPGSSTPITTASIPGPGKPFTVSVYYQSSVAANGVDIFVGYDSTTTTGSSAAPTAQKLTLSGDATSAVSNPDTANFPSFFGGQLGGGQSTTAGTRPYGDDLFFGTTGGTTYVASSPTHLFDITFMNAALAAGASSTLSIYNGGTGSDFTTYVTPDGSTFVRPATAFLTVTAAPEPSQYAAFANRPAGARHACSARPQTGHAAGGIAATAIPIVAISLYFDNKKRSIVPLTKKAACMKLSHSLCSRTLALLAGVAALALPAHAQFGTWANVSHVPTYDATNFGLGTMLLMTDGSVMAQSGGNTSNSTKRNTDHRPHASPPRSICHPKPNAFLIC